LLFVTYFLCFGILCSHEEIWDMVWKFGWLLLFYPRRMQIAHATNLDP
jgi:hypothetical protein